MNTLTTYEGLAAVASMKARVEAVDWREHMVAIDSAPKNRRVEMMQQLAAQGVAPFGTIRRKYYAYQKSGAAALVDRRRVKTMTAQNPWIECYMTYIENDKNTSVNGYRRMMADFRAGKPMPGAVGTWREMWMRERPGVPVPAECPLDWTPHGATYANLQATCKLNPNYYFNIMATRQGRKAASGFVLPVLTSRVGLAVLAKVEYDDVWHNIDIMLGGKVVQPLEFAGYDVASGYKCSSIMKPRFARADGVRDNLKEQQFRFLFAYDHIVRGFHRGGIEDIVEHGTTAIRANVEKQIKAIPGMGDLITIRRSGILSEQVHAGLFIGNGGGNFKMKALCEGAHNILHNRSAHLLGNRGRDAAHLHESEPALVKYEERLMAAAAKLSPEFALKLQAGLMTFDEYCAAFREIEAALMADPEHKLEGWDSKTVAEWRLSATSNEWHDFKELESMSPEERTAIAAVVGRDARLRRVRPMSRFEAYRDGLRSGEIVKVDDWYLPHFMDFEKDSIEVTVRKNGLIGFKDALLYGRDEMLYRASVKTRAGWNQALAPDTRVSALFNPMMPEKIWLVDRGDGHTLGTCALYNRAPAYDRHAIEIALGDQARDLASKVLPVRGRHQAEAEARAERMANNLRVMKEAANAEARGPAPTGDGFSLEELNGVSSDFSPAGESPCGSGFVAAGESFSDLSSPAEESPCGSGSVDAGEVSSPNADALAFLNEVTSV